jgi:hypothetical protein
LVFGVVVGLVGRGGISSRKVKVWGFDADTMFLAYKMFCLCFRTEFICSSREAQVSVMLVRLPREEEWSGG